MTEIESYIARNEMADINDMKLYFKYKYRGLYYQQMKTYAAKKLRNEGLIYEDIAKIINVSKHESAMHHVKVKKIDKQVENVINQNFDKWVLSKSYPMTAVIHEYDSKFKEKYQTSHYVLINK